MYHHETMHHFVYDCYILYLSLLVFDSILIIISASRPQYTWKIQDNIIYECGTGYGFLKKSNKHEVRVCF